MRREFLKLELPEKYRENLIEYRPMIDGVPEWPDFASAGWSMEGYRKFTKLYAIEGMKYRLAEGLEEDEFDEEEIDFAERMIQEAIEEYNEM